MPMLFDVNIEDKEEIKASKFVSKLQKKAFVSNNEIYLKNYIDADIGIAFSHIKNNYKKYVCQAGWSEEKFEDVIYIIAKHRKMLIPSVFLNYGSKYDDGKLTKEIQMEKRKYVMKEESQKTHSISKEEQELLDYISKHGGM